MAGKRIYEIAKEYQISSEALMALLKELKFEVKSHMSAVTPEMLAAIEDKFKREKEIVKKEISEKQRKQKERARAEALQAKDPFVALPESAAPETEGEIEIEKLPIRKKDEILKQERAKEAPRKVKDKFKPDFRQEKILAQKRAEESVKKTLSQLDTSRRPKKYIRRGDEEEAVALEAKVIKVAEFISVAELASLMNLRPAQVIAKCLELGMMATINQRLDLDTIETIALEFGYAVEQEKEVGAEEEEAGEETLVPRPPVVTIMGHVDHGKTSLLDYIRKSNIIAGEFGGITQHIGAYEVQLPKGHITFLDTPGHEAFTAMRARGVQITDIVVLVVAADSQVMPQTIEAIDHARAAGVPIIVAINKIDLPTANPELIKNQLAKYNLVPEEWGGKTIMVEISAKLGKNVDKLLEMILLQAELLELTADPNRRAKGTIVEAKLDKGKGPIATVLVQSGTLKIGDPFVSGPYFGKVRAMFNERGQSVQSAGPSAPAQVLGSAGVPQAGDSFVVMEAEVEARELANKRSRLKREKELRLLQSVALEEVYQKVKEGAIKELRLIIKGDVDGSVEVLSDTLEKMSTAEVKVTVIHKGVGAVAESDVLLAAASQAIIIGFHVRPDLRARELAHQQGVDIRLYNIIYEVQNEIRKALEGLLEPEIRENIKGVVEVREIFRISKVGIIAGCFVQRGSLKLGDQVRVIRDGQTIYQGKIGSLRRFKDDVREVATGLECGVKIENYNDLKPGDVLEVFEVIQLARKLEEIPR
jgi:translation initiation factor IF-2